MPSDNPKGPQKTWDELVTAASEETDPEKIATLAEEIFAALEKRQQARSHTPTQNP